MRKILRIFGRLIILLLLIALIWIVANMSLFLYGLDQLRGQLRIIYKARPIQEVLNDSLVTDSVKTKIQFIEEVKKFAVDSLKLKPSDNYNTFYDQQKKPLLWVLTASAPYEIKAHEWKFPILGSVSYKGFFDYDDGKSEELILKSEGFDTYYTDVSAWSTLGWFHDPILSNMIYRSEGQIAELIIHELTHSTIYLKSNVNLNENLASVCGEQGAIRFLESKYGPGSGQLREYLKRKEDYDKFSKQMLKGTHMLDSLYALMSDSVVLRKAVAKDKLIREIVRSLDTVSFHNPKRYKGFFDDRKPNNAYFLDFIRYDAQKDEMMSELQEKFNGDIRKYIDYLKESN